MNFRRLFLFVVFAFTLVGCDKRNPAIDRGSWTRSAMTHTFLEALLYEYAFWDYGYNGDEKDYSYVNRLQDWL